MKEHYYNGLEYGYPRCCIMAFYTRYYTTAIIADIVAVYLRFIINTEHNTQPTVKCPYHYTKSLLTGNTKYVLYKVL